MQTCALQRRAVALAAFAATALTNTRLTSAAEVPIISVTLYKHGVGFFEREGSIAEGDAAHLDFKTADMNDVRKSIFQTAVSAM